MTTDETSGRASSASGAVRRSRREPHWLKPLQLGLLVGLMAFAPLAIGTVHLWARTVVFVGAGLLLLITLGNAWRQGKQVPLTVPLVALLVLVGATALQLVPLPSSWIAVLSPTAHEIFSTTLGDDYGHHPLTIDPAGTWHELAKLGAYAAFFAAAVMLLTRTSRRRLVIMAVVATASLVALIGVADLLLGNGTIFFLYRPEARGVNEVLVRGTFVNGNHFGALMALAAPCALALGLREPRLRVPAFACTIILNIGAVLSMSRAAIIAAPLAQALAFGLDRWQLRQGGPRRAEASSGVRLALVLTVVATVGTAAFMAKSRLDAAFDNTVAVELDDPFGNTRSKFYAWSAAGQLVLDYPWTGAGRGAFEQAFSRVYDRGGYFRFPWVENAYLQMFCDFGVPVAAALLVLGGWAVVLAFRRLAHDPLATGAMGAILGYAIHEVADFSIELPGVALPMLAILATLFARRSSEPEGGRRLYRARPALLLAPVAVIVAAVVAVRAPRADAAALALRERLRDPARPLPALLAEAKAARAAHPADFYIQIFVAERLARDNDPAAMSWLNDAIFLNPTHPAPHFAAAELFAVRHRKPQALLEYRTAAALSPAPVRVWDRVLERYPALDDLLKTVPETDRDLGRFATWLLSKKRPDDAALVRDRLLVLRPHDLDLLSAQTSYALAKGDLARARRTLEPLQAMDHSRETQRLGIRLAALEGRLDEAARQLDALNDRSAATFEVELEVALRYSAAGQRDAAWKRLERLDWISERELRIKWHTARAEVERRAGHEHAYEWELKEAARLKKKP